MSITIRPLQKSDIQQVTSLCVTAQPERVRQLKVHLRQINEPEFVAEPGLRQWVAVETKTQQCVGYTSFWNVVRGKYRMDLMAHPDWRRRRVGSNLFETLLVSLQTTPATSLQAHTWEDRNDGRMTAILERSAPDPLRSGRNTGAAALRPR